MRYFMDVLALHLFADLYAPFVGQYTFGSQPTAFNDAKLSTAAHCGADCHLVKGIAACQP